LTLFLSLSVSLSLTHIHTHTHTTLISRFALKHTHSTHRYSNGHDAVYDNVKAQIRRRWGFYAVNETNKPLLKRLAISRGQDPELSDPISNSILRMRHTLLYRIRRQIGGTTKWYSATRRFFEPNGRSRRISKKAQNSNNKERLAPRVALRLPHTVYVDTTSQKEIRIELPSNNASCNLTGFMWKTKGYVPNVRFSRCTYGF
jgi:hypothetical protein